MQLLIKDSSLKYKQNGFLLKQLQNFPNHKYGEDVKWKIVLTV